MDDQELETILRIEVLLNAKTFGGSPNPKAVTGKLLGKYAELRPRAKELISRVTQISEEVGQMSAESIADELNLLDPEAEQRQRKQKVQKSEKRKKQKQEIPELDDAVSGKFVVRYAPDPSKYPHIGQGMNYLVNRMYADKYNGKAVLRFDDTNPAIVKPKYFDAIREGLQWLGCTWDEEIIASQHLDTFYELGREWIKRGDMYVCQCRGELLSKNREAGISCEHRETDTSMSQQLFEKMLAGEFNAGEAVVRLMGDMQSDNNVMRDPIMFRIVRDQHPLLDEFYPVFPTYDLESAYFDCKAGITHIIRSGEFGTMRQELQSHIINLLDGTPPVFRTFGRFNIQGCPTKGRVIRELVESGLVTGWDDIRLITLAGLKKRGIHPNTPRVLIQEAGLTPKSSTIAWVTLEKKSKELLEPIAKRYFMVVDPVQYQIINPEVMELELPLHPEKDLGNRSVKVSDTIFISAKDADLNPGDEIRLKDYRNVRILENNEMEITGNEIIATMPKIQWVSTDARAITLKVPDILEKKKGEINEKSMTEISGLIEPAVTAVQDEVIQLERIGFARIDTSTDRITGHIVHLI